MNREKLGKTRNHAILKTEKPLGTRLERLGGGEGLSGFLNYKQQRQQRLFVLYESKEKHRIELKKYT